MLDTFYKINCKINDRFWHSQNGYQYRYGQLVMSNPKDGRTVVDLGSGSVDLRGRFSDLSPGTDFVISCDLDADRLKANPNPRRVAADGTELPFSAESMDVIVSDNAFEHLDEPEGVLRECARVLKPKGRLIFATPHKYSYISILAALAPFRCHMWIKRFQGTPTINVSETFYRLNTPSDLKRHCLAAGLEVQSLEFFMGAPCYTLRLPPPVHLVAVLLHSFVNKVATLRKWCAVSLVGVLQRPACPSTSALDRAGDALAALETK